MTGSLPLAAPLTATTDHPVLLQEYFLITGFTSSKYGSPAAGTRGGY
jgi:hypothetical protein